MNRLLTLVLIGLAGLLASCGSTLTSSTQPPTNDTYSVAVSPDRLTLNAGDWSVVQAVADVTNQNTTPKPISPQPIIQFLSSDPRVSISPAGEVCAGHWDGEYLTCTPSVFGKFYPPCVPNPPNPKVCFPYPNPLAGQLDLPTGYVTITALDASHNASGTSLLSVHQRPTGISLTSDWSVPVGNTLQARSCILQGQQVQYFAAPVLNGKPVGNIFQNDYTWSVADLNVAAISSFGFVIAKNPGVTSVYATLNGIASVPQTFVTCPPSAILLQTSPFTGNNPGSGTNTTADLTIPKGTQRFVSATLSATDGITTAPIKTASLDFVTTDLLTGGFSPTLPLISTLTANTSGRFTMMAACEPADCNASVPDFILPTGVRETEKSAGFGYPIYSNVIGVTVTGITGSTVLVTGTIFANGAAAHRLLAYDSESLAVTHTVVVPSTPNSLVIAPSGATAYIGDACPALTNCDGLVVVNLSSYQSSIKSYPVVGGQSTDVVTGTVLGISPDSRYVLLSDVPNGLVFLIDTTGTKTAARYTIPGIRAVAFTPDSTNIWIGGDSGVYVFKSDTFVKIPANAIKNVQALAWTPDGQSYFASSSLSVADPTINYSTCDDQFLQSLPGNPINLAATVGSIPPATEPAPGVPHVAGLSVSDNHWYDYSVTTSAQVATGDTEGNVCLSTVHVNPPVTTPSSLLCTADQITFSPRLQRQFVTGVVSQYGPGFVSGDTSCAQPQAEIYGYDMATQKEITLTPTNKIVPLSGGVLNDGRKLYVGTYDPANGALLHRFDLASKTEDVVTVTTGTPPNTVTTIPASVALVPSFVAVVPK